MLDNCKISNGTWREFIAGQVLDSFISMLRFVTIPCLHPGLHQLNDNMNLVQTMQTTVLTLFRLGEGTHCAPLSGFFPAVPKRFVVD